MASSRTSKRSSRKSKTAAAPKRKSSARSSSKKKKTAVKTTARKTTARKKRGSGKRDLVKTPTGTFFAHREADGSFREMDEVGRSLAADRRQKAKTKVGSGYGDQGDR